MAIVSIKQIAAIAGVSRGTVDRALNDRYGIDPDLKARILKIAEDLGYRSNRAGKILSLVKTPPKIGVQMPSVGNDFFLEVERGLQAAATEFADFGLELVIRTMKGFDHKEQIRQIRELVNEGINALAFVPINHPDVMLLLNELSEKGIPVITFNSDVDDGQRLAYVGNDYWHSGATAAGVLRLLTRGQTTYILILTGSIQILGHNQRVTGFNETLRNTCPHLKIVEILETLDDEQLAYERTLEAFREHPEIGAVYLAAGGAAGVGRAIEERGLAGQVLMIGNDLTDAERSLLERDILTATIGQQPFEQGYKPIAYLFNYLLDGTLPPTQTLTRNEIFIKEHFTLLPNPLT